MDEWLDLVELARDGKLDPVVGREEETARVVRVLMRRTRRNALLVGRPGVGKTAIVEGLAQRIAASAVPPPLAGTRVVTLDLGMLLAGARSRGDARTIEELFSEAVEARRAAFDRDASEHGAVRLVLFVDELPLLSDAAAEGPRGMTSLLRSVVGHDGVALLSETTPAHYELCRARGADVDRYFEVVPVAEPSVDETERILRGVVGRFAAFHRVRFADDALRAASVLGRSLAGRSLPDPAIDLLDEAGSLVRARVAPGAGDGGALEVGRADVEAVAGTWRAEHASPLSERARRALDAARDEARRYAHDYLGTEHLLLALLGDADCGAARILADFGVTPDLARAAVEFRVAPGMEPPGGDPEMGHRLRRALDRAQDAARDEGAVHVGTEHMLFGLADDSDSVAARTLVRLGADLGAVRRKVLGTERVT
jgi:ATP-dependent Clp protease ATP-binding subunit ClpA